MFHSSVLCACSAFVPQRSSPEKSSYFFVYEIKIENMGGNTVQLRTRCWNISDANGKLNTVRYDATPSCLNAQDACCESSIVPEDAHACLVHMMLVLIVPLPCPDIGTAAAWKPQRLVCAR